MSSSWCSLYRVGNPAARGTGSKGIRQRVPFVPYTHAARDYLGTSTSAYAAFRSTAALLNDSGKYSPRPNESARLE